MQISTPRQVTATVGALSTLALFLTACGGGLGASSAADTSRALSGQTAAGATVSGASPNTTASSPGGASAGNATPNKDNIVPRSAIKMGPVATAPTSTYSQQVAGQYTVVNNTWGVKSGLSAGWSQQTGISDVQADGSVAFATVWNFPGRCGGACEVLSFPEIVYGRSAGVVPVGGAKLPKKVGEITALSSQYSHIEGTGTGLGHVTYDVWTSRTPDSMAPGQRLAEIMLSVESIGGYGVPKSPPSAAAGREGQVAAGRNAHGYVGREQIGGAAYDVYYSPPGTQLAWAFIVFQPVNPPGRNGHVLNWVPLFEYMKSKNWISANDYLANIEFGVEAIVNPNGGSKGDLTISGFKVNVE